MFVVNLSPFFRTHLLFHNFNLRTKSSQELTILTFVQSKTFCEHTTKTFAISTRSIDRRHPLTKQRNILPCGQSNIIFAKLRDDNIHNIIPDRSAFKNQKVIPTTINRNEFHKFSGNFTIPIHKVFEEITEDFTFSLSTTNITGIEKNTSRSLRVFHICVSKQFPCLWNVITTGRDFTEQVYTFVESGFVCFGTIESFSGVQFSFKCGQERHNFLQVNVLFELEVQVVLLN